MTLEGREPNGLDGLRRQLDRRQARRYRRRRLARWRRRRLMVRRLVIERELAEAQTEALVSLHADELRRVEARLLRNATRLHR